MSSTNEIGLARRQRAYAVLESVAGTLAFPSATQDFIRPAGNGSINQVPAFVDSEELQDTLDILDQFQNATPPGTWMIPMYVRPAGSIGGRMQGQALFEALQGSRIAPSTVTAALAANMSTATSSVAIDTIAGGVLPEVGVILIGTEYIRYSTITRATRSSTTATIGGLTRGYSGTATSHATDAVVSLKSMFFKQAATSPTLSIWLETDHFVQVLSGATVAAAVIGASNEGGLKVTFSGEAMRMYWAGKDALTATATATPNKNIVVSDVKRFTVGAYIYNATQNENRSGAGYVIASINATTNTLTLVNSPESAWATADVIRGYMPTGTVIGAPLEGKDTSVTVNDISARLKNTDINVGVPKVYITDELGATFPEDYLENVRDITMNMNLYFKKADAKYFKDGYSGTDVPVKFRFGSEVGSTMEVVFPKVKITVPAINIAAPAVELNMPSKALGTEGEDSCEIVFH